MNSIIEAAKFEPEPTFENTSNEIKSDHLKSTTSFDMNLSYMNLKNPLFLMNIQNMIS